MGLLKKNQLKALVLGGVSMTLFLLAIFYTGSENQWFDKKIKFQTELLNAEGLRKGTPVELLGLKVGEITKISVNDENKVLISFTIKDTYLKQLRQGTIVRVSRNMLIGDKKLDLEPGPIEGAGIKGGEKFEGRDSTELADLLNGKNLASVVLDKGKNQEGLLKIINLLQEIANNLNEETIKAVGEVLPRAVDFFESGNKVFIGMHKDLLEHSILKRTMYNLNKVIYPVAKEELLLKKTLSNLNKLSGQFAKNPRFSSEVLKTLKEVTFTLKAMQKSWFLRSHVKDLKKSKVKKK